jgi:hypothetical protein
MNEFYSEAYDFIILIFLLGCLNVKREQLAKATNLIEFIVCQSLLVSKMKI